MSYVELLTLTGAEAVLTVAALAVLLIDALLRQHSSRMRNGIALTVSLFGVAASVVWLLVSMPEAKQAFYGGMLIRSPLAHYGKLTILLLTAVTVLFSVGQTFTRHPAEYCALLLMAAVGMMFLVSSENVLLLFMALELLSLSLYVLTAFAKDRPGPAEAALRYFLIGGTTAASMLFGLSLLYGLTGELTLSGIAAGLADKPGQPLAIMASIMVMAALGFKIAAAPFHLWAPDTYSEAPWPSAVFIAAASKVASFILLVNVLAIGLGNVAGMTWSTSGGAISIIAALAALSIVVGNLAAIVQKSVRRLIAYSAVAHAGYAVIGLLSENQIGFAPVIFYAFTYALTVAGALAISGLVQNSAGSDGFESFAGLSRRSPLIAACMMVFMLSLAGIPPLVGFFGKFYVFAAALAGASQQWLWLVALALGMSAVSLYYYLQVLKQIYIAELPATSTGLRVSPWAYGTIVGLAASVIGFGLAPDLLLAHLLGAVRAGF